MRFSNTLPCCPLPPESVAAKSANESSPVPRAELLCTWLFALPLVMLSASANVLRMREFLISESSMLDAQNMQIMCSTQMLSIVMSLTFAKSKTLPGPSMRDV
ncbi:hypothetical protein D3C74_363030 [compost metagenome]